MICQGELARSRPSPRYLTTFYLTIAAGGAMGGVFVALIAPRIFTEFSEYQIGLAAACLLGFRGMDANRRAGSMDQPQFRCAPASDGAVDRRRYRDCAATMTTGKQGAVVSARNFYGILRVMAREDGNGPFRELQHGRTRHGFEYLQAARKDWPTSYYGPHSGIAIALNALDKPNRRIGGGWLGRRHAGGLGTSGRHVSASTKSIPMWSRSRETWFSFLSDSKAQTEVVLGDARVQLERELALGRSQDFDLIAVDAFSSDSIPMHLADGGVRGHLPAATGARRRPGAAYIESSAGSRSGGAGDGAAIWDGAAVQIVSARRS